MTLSQVVVDIVLARVRAGIREHGGNNRGPEVDRYTKGVFGPDVDLTKAYSWCTSGLYDAFVEGSLQLGIKNPFPKTAKAVTVWELFFALCGESNYEPGFVYVLDHGPPGNVLTEWKNSHYTDSGHIGIITAVDAYGVPDEVSGNTNLAGSREGNAWGLHRGYPEVSHGGVLLGLLNFDKLVAPAVA